MDRLEEALREPVTKAMREAAADMADSLAVTYRQLGDATIGAAVKETWRMAAEFAEQAAAVVRAEGNA